MLSSVLKSIIAIQANRMIMRATHYLKNVASASPLLHSYIAFIHSLSRFRHIDRNVNSGHLAIAGYVRMQLTFAKQLPYAKGLRFVVTNLFVDDLQLVKGRGDIDGIEIVGRNYTAICISARNPELPFHRMKTL